MSDIDVGDDAPLEKVPETVEPDPEPAEVGPPPPVTPDMGSEARHRRAMYEREVNDGAAAFAEEARAAYIEHVLEGRTVRLVAVNDDGSDYAPDDDHDTIAPETALAAAADAGLVPYSEWSKDELADECRNRGLAVSGTKDELIDRLEADDAQDAAAADEE